VFLLPFDLSPPSPSAYAPSPTVTSTMSEGHPILGPTPEASSVHGPMPSEWRDELNLLKEQIRVLTEITVKGLKDLKVSDTLPPFRLLSRTPRIRFASAHQERRRSPAPSFPDHRFHLPPYDDRLPDAFDLISARGHQLLGPIDGSAYESRGEGRACGV
jgi:hypothetical protein